MNILKTQWIPTVLGPMMAIASEDELYLLEFSSKNKLTKEIGRFEKQGFILESGFNDPLRSIQTELDAYFKKELIDFKTPFRVFGTAFQQKVWEALLAIPYGDTKSYAAQSAFLGKPTAYRAVANANGANQLSILIPCHRVIASDGTLGGYGGGLEIKQWLLNHEKGNKGT